jgi:hypothetical protein
VGGVRVCFAFEGMEDEFNPSYTMLKAMSFERGADRASRGVGGMYGCSRRFGVGAPIGGCGFAVGAHANS